MRFIKKPVEVVARQWDGTRTAATDLIDWIIANGGTARWVDYDPDQVRTVLHIDTLEGTMAAKHGDWIIQGVHGEFYPCKPDIFTATYQPVNPDGHIDGCDDGCWGELKLAGSADGERVFCPCRCHVLEDLSK